jgi:hypothetical protein
MHCFNVTQIKSGRKKARVIKGVKNEHWRKERRYRYERD